MELSEQIWGAIKESDTNDYQQRSALGIARTWVEKRKPHERVVYKEYANETKRDDLADKLIALLDEAGLSKADYIQVLGTARDKVNEPFLDSTMNGQKERLATMKPKERKKRREMTLFWTIVAVIGVLVVLAVTHSVAWLRGFESGKHSAALEALNERAKALNLASKHALMREDDKQ